MDIAKVIGAIWRHKIIMVVFIIIGLFLGNSALSNPKTTYETTVGILLDEPTFGYGNLSSGLQRAAALARTYPALIQSEIIQKRVILKIGKFSASLTAANEDDSPLVTLVVQGQDPKEITKVAKTTVAVFIQYIRAEQKKNMTPTESRVVLYSTGPPSAPAPLKSRTLEIAFLMFLSPVVIGATLALVLENIKLNKPAQIIAQTSAPAVETPDIRVSRTQRNKNKVG